MCREPILWLLQTLAEIDQKERERVKCEICGTEKDIGDLSVMDVLIVKNGRRAKREPTLVCLSCQKKNLTNLRKAKKC